MVVTIDGKNRIRDLLSADIYDTALGTGTTAATSGDTDLETEVSATTATPTQTVGNQLINSSHITLSTVGNGSTLTEIGVFMNGGSVLLSRSVFPDFVKTASLELHSITTFRIN